MVVGLILGDKNCLVSFLKQVKCKSYGDDFWIYLFPYKKYPKWFIYHYYDLLNIAAIENLREISKILAIFKNYYVLLAVVDGQWKILLQSVTKIVRFAQPPLLFNVGCKFACLFLVSTAWHGFFRLGTKLSQGEGVNFKRF